MNPVAMTGVRYERCDVHEMPDCASCDVPVPGMMMKSICIILLLFISLVLTFSIGRMEDMPMNNDLVQAAECIAENVQAACRENPGVVRLEVHLGLFYHHTVWGISNGGEPVLLYDSDEDTDSLQMLDYAWANHSGEHSYFDEFQMLVAQFLESKGCPPAVFPVLEGQPGRLLQKRNELWNAVGDRKEVSEVLAAISPLWDFQVDGCSGNMDLIEAGAWSLSGQETFTLSWTWQEADEASDEYFQLRVELTYPANADNLAIRECEWIDSPDVDFAEYVRSTDSYKWALGKEAAAVRIYVDGT